MELEKFNTKPIYLDEDFGTTFENALKLQTPLQKQIKFLLLKKRLEDEPFLLIFEASGDTEYHIHALLTYMDSAEIEKIFVFGGGCIEYRSLRDTLTFSGRSSSFDNLHIDQLILLTKRYWPTTSVKFELDRPASRSHEEYTYDKLEEKLYNP